jgi:hypothetical protein
MMKLVKMLNVSVKVHYLNVETCVSTNRQITKIVAAVEIPVELIKLARMVNVYVMDL